MKATSPRRPWYQFSLRTMLIVMVLSSAGFGYWVHWSREWIRQRQAWRDRHHVRMNTQRATAPNAPWGLLFFGEQGEGRISPGSFNEQREAMRLFPEASVSQPPPPPR